MYKVLVSMISFFSVAVCSNTQDVVFEPEIISVSNRTTHEISFTQDWKTLYFARTPNNKWQKAQLGFKSIFSNGKWSIPAKVEFADSLYNMSISPDGSRVLFSRGDKTWLCIKEHEKWSVPIDLNSTYDYSFNGGYYHILNDDSFYFSSTQEDELHPYDDIYYVAFQDGHYKKPKPLGNNINTEATEFSPWVNRKNNLIIFTRYDNSSVKNTGIFISRFVENKWQKAQKIEALKYGWGVFVREDTGTLYYTVGGLILEYELATLNIDINNN